MDQVIVYQFEHRCSVIYICFFLRVTDDMQSAKVWYVIASPEILDGSLSVCSIMPKYLICWVWLGSQISIFRYILSRAFAARLSPSQTGLLHHNQEEAWMDKCITPSVKWARYTVSTRFIEAWSHDKLVVSLLWPRVGLAGRLWISAASKVLSWA